MIRECFKRNNYKSFQEGAKRFDDAMKGILDTMIERVNKKRKIHINLSPAQREKLVKSVLGLTADEAENAFARVVVSRGTLQEQDIKLLVAIRNQDWQRSPVTIHKKIQFSDIDLTFSKEEAQKIFEKTDQDLFIDFETS